METSELTRPRMPLPWFFVLTFVLSWGFWLVPLLAGRGVFALPGSLTAWLLAGSFCPFVMAFLARYREGGWSAVGHFALRALRWRIGPGYLAAMLLLAPTLGFLAACAYARLGGPAATLAVPLAQIPLLFGLMFFMGGSLNEEFGWAYAIDGLQRNRSPLHAAILLGLIWGGWHLPLFFIVGVTQSFLPFWAFLLFAVALRLWFVWAYEGSGKSVLATLLFHTTTNLTLNLFVLVDRSPARNESGFIVFAALAGVTAALLVAAAPLYRRARAPLAQPARP